MNIQTSFEEYLAKSPTKQEIHYWDLPRGLCAHIELSKLPHELKTHKRFRGNTQTLTINRLISNFGKDPEIDEVIRYFFNWRNKREKLFIPLPFKLNNEDYVQLYSLMLSEGSCKNTFALHVPEEEFHKIFKESLKNLFGIANVNSRFSHNTKLSFASRRLRYFLPVPEHIPS